MTDLSKQIAALSPGKLALLERRLKEGGPHGSRMPEIPRRRTDEALPLSFAQERLWFLQQLVPSSALYNLPAMVRLSGPLDADALQESLNALLRRHEILRTSFVVVNGSPVQVVIPQATLDLPIVDLRGTP